MRHPVARREHQNETTEIIIEQLFTGKQGVKSQIETFARGRRDDRVRERKRERRDKKSGTVHEKIDGRMLNRGEIFAVRDKRG